jgi:hypothetical protein
VSVVACAELRLQRIGHRFGNVALHRKNIAQLAIVDFGPEMRVRERVDQLHIDPHLIVHFLHAAFENVQRTELLRDIGQILGRTLEFLRRRARNYFQVRNFCQTGENFILHAFGEKGVVGIATQIIERQHRDRFRGQFIGLRRRCFTSSAVASQKE